MPADDMESPESLEKPKRFQFSLGCAIVLMILAGLGVGGIVAIYFAVHDANEGEYTLHAKIVMIEVVERYVKDHPGRWPRSWEDLGSAPSRQLLLAWPKDSESIKKRIQIDFDARLEDLAKQTANNFTGIKSLGPHFVNSEPDVTPLLDSIRESVKASAAKNLNP